MMPKILLQLYAILVKNLQNSLTNKKKFLGMFIFPTIISLLYVVMQRTKSSNPIISIIFGVLLKMYIAMIGISSVRQVVTLFINERQQKHRQYQIIFGLSSKWHTLSNLFFMKMYMSLFLIPFYITINYYGFQWSYIFMFASFVMSSLTLSLMMTAFFKDHKIASQMIGMFFSLSAILALTYSGGNKNQKGQIVYTTMQYIAMIIPNSSFSIAILNNNPHASLLSLFAVKFYLVIYLIVQFPNQYISYFNKCNEFFRKKFRPTNQQNLLTQQFNLNQQIAIQPSNENVQMGHDCMIKLSNLIKSYKIKQGQFNALNKVNLQIKKRQIFGLLGRNGAGKTTLVDILTNVTKPTTGTFKINFQQSEHEQRTGICYQHQILYEDLTVQQHLYFYARIKYIHTELTQTIQEIVNMLGINNELNKKVKQLSGGNKRKLSVAIALLGKPQLLIFDEPTSGLDPLSRRSVWQILQKIRREQNSSIILTTHHLDQAQVLSDFICVIQKGSIIVQNTPQQIKLKYGNGFYLSLTFDFLKTQLKEIRNITNAIKQALEFKYCLERVEELEYQHGVVKLFLKFNQLENTKEFQIKFKNVIQWIQSIQQVKMEIQANSLEQSFIAILKDPENLGIKTSNQSLQLANRLARPVNLSKTYQEDQNQSFISKIKTFIKQLVGVFVRCLYFHKGQLMKFFVTYNINILIFIFAMMFNKFILEKLGDATKGSSQNQQMQQANASKNQSYSNNLLILQGYIIMAGAFMTLPIYEKQKNIRRVFNSRGLSSLAYWMGTFLFDYGCYLINLIILSQFVSPQSFKFVNGQGIQPFIALGVCMIVYTYVFSNLFEKITTANTWFSIINMVFGFVLLPMIIIGDKTILGNLKFIKYFYPFYDLNVLVLANTTKQMSQAMGGKQLIQNDGPYIYYTIIFYILILIAIEIRLSSRIKSLFKKEILQPTSDSNIQLDKVFKQYGKVEALKNVNYFVGNQRLALLGHNGAGKSTTFGILSGQINPTCGNAYLDYHLKQPEHKIMRSAGICYQQNCLWQNLTPIQIFNVFSWIVPIPQSEKQIQWMFQSLQFETTNYNKRFQNLSGGNKRKICMAIALFGNPTIRLLDECSTGLDPSSRVAMVQTIKNSNTGSTIFTTHSMGEAENLCSKTVIMKKGQVQQFDYIFTLKQKYYNCFWIDLILNTQDTSAFIQLPQKQKVDNLQKAIMTLVLQEFQIKNSLPKVFAATKQHKIRVQFDKEKWAFHKGLQLVYKLKQTYTKDKILSISILQPKLQDVYLKLTREEDSTDENRFHFQGYNDEQNGQQIQMATI